MKRYNKNLYYLYEHLATTINLSDFLEAEAGCKLKWTQHEVKAKCNCPLHDDKNASLSVFASIISVSIVAKWLSNILEI